jgi:alginate O-acetyltransferase complex protein AlgI
MGAAGRVCSRGNRRALGELFLRAIPEHSVRPVPDAPGAGSQAPMLFNSCTFLCFFAGVLLLHSLPLPWNWKKGNLLLASYLFYAAWNPPFVLLLWLSTVVDWYVARWIAQTEAPGRRRVLLLFSLVLNLGLLGVFKYTGFLLQNLTTLLHVFHVAFRPAPPTLILPPGISFYTFMTLSYTLDIYYRRAAPCARFLDYALFLTFFPHLVAGPIVRAAEFTPQLEAPKQASPGQLGLGLSLMILGLFEKTVLADYLLAPVSELVFRGGATPDRLSAVGGVLAFTAQIFYDFSGYTTCAIGAAMCLGFAFPENFRSPYSALGFSDFWARWHMSLSRWLRDYLYIPLGGNRHGAFKTYRNLMITMLLGGLWHGGRCNFILGGGHHGSYLIAERLRRGQCGPQQKTPRGLARAALTLTTFTAVCVTWIFFRAPSLARALLICRSLVASHVPNATPLILGPNFMKVLAVTGLMVGTHWLMRDTTWEALFRQMAAPLRAVLLAGILILIVLAPGEVRAFIYFQF